MDCSFLQKIAYDATKLLLYVDYLDPDEIYTVCEITKLPEEDVIQTKCGYVTTTVIYLLDLKFSREVELGMFSPDRAYEIHLRGLDDMDVPTRLDHAFLLISELGSWFVLDSYIGCRDLTCRVVNLDYIIKSLRNLSKKFSSKDWRIVSNCRAEYEAKRINVYIQEYTFGENSIEAQMNSLVDMAKNRLLKEEVGKDDLYLSFLSKTLDEEEALTYLETLYM